MHIYAFGSICRGDVDTNSDIDLLAVVEGQDTRFDPNKYSIYSYSRTSELWKEGSPFAWHLHLESKLIFSSTGSDFICDLGSPSYYDKGVDDCNKFYEIFMKARKSIEKANLCEVFDLSTIFLSIRNFATCYSLAFSRSPDFSRNSALSLGSKSIILTPQQYAVFERARILSTRGLGEAISREDTQLAMNSIGIVNDWMVKLLESKEVMGNERVQ